jgi:uncharacterized protein YjiS (DUF1127 family)
MVGSIAARARPAAGQSLTGFRHIARALKGSLGRTRSGRRHRGRIGELRALDDRLLADIGLSRAHLAYAEYAAQSGSLPKGWNHGLRR